MATKVTAKTKVAEKLDDSFIIMATPVEKEFSDGSTIRVVQECSLSEVLNILRALKQGKKVASVEKYGLEEAGSVLVIKGSVQPMSGDMRSIQLDGVEYPLTDAKSEFSSSFVDIKV